MVKDEPTKKDSRRGSVQRNFVYAKSGYVADESLAVVQDGYEHEFSIIPKDSFELDREVVVKDNAAVAGEVYGSQISIGENCEMYGILYSKSDVRIGNGSHLFGHVIAGLGIEFGDEVISNQDLVAQKVKIGSRAMIYGSIFAEESVEIGPGSVVRGLVCCPNGSISIGNDCVLYDVIARDDIMLGAGVKVEDEVVASEEGRILFGTFQPDPNTPKQNLFLPDPDNAHPLKDQVRIYRLNVCGLMPTPVCVMKDVIMGGNGDQINSLATAMYHFRNMETGKTPIHETAFELRERRERQLYNNLPAIGGSKKKIDGHRLAECPNCGASGTTSLIAPYHYRCTSCDTETYDNKLHEEARRIYEFLKTGAAPPAPAARQAASVTPTKAKSATIYAEPVAKPAAPLKTKIAIPKAAGVTQPVAPPRMQFSEPKINVSEISKAIDQKSSVAFSGNVPICACGMKYFGYGLDEWNILLQNKEGTFACRGCEASYEIGTILEITGGGAAPEESAEPSIPKPVPPHRIQFTEPEPVVIVPELAAPVKIKITSPTRVSTTPQGAPLEAGSDQAGAGSMAALKEYIRNEIPDLPEDQLAYVVKRYLSLKTPDRQRAFILMMKKGGEKEKEKSDGLDFVDL